MFQKKLMSGERESNREVVDLIEDLYMTPDLRPYIPIQGEVVFVAPDVSPYYRVDYVQGVRLSGVDLIQAARAEPDSSYYLLDDLSRRILDCRYPITDQKPMTFKEISSNFGVTISQAYSLIKGIRAKLTSEIKLD